MDDYRKDEASSLPLTFDKIYEDRSPKSSAPLFQLPFEMLGAITRQLHSSVLPSLSLVNSDCRQIVRSIRYASVNLDYSLHAWRLLQVLSDERAERMQHDGFTLLPSLGACIRRLRIATDHRKMSIAHHIDPTTLDDLRRRIYHKD